MATHNGARGLAQSWGPATTRPQAEKPSLSRCSDEDVGRTLTLLCLVRHYLLPLIWPPPHPPLLAELAHPAPEPQSPGAVCDSPPVTPTYCPPRAPGCTLPLPTALASALGLALALRPMALPFSFLEGLPWELLAQLVICPLGVPPMQTSGPPAQGLSWSPVPSSSAIPGYDKTTVVDRRA